MSGAGQKKTYPCFACQKQGFEDVMVVLGGKDEYGKTIYFEPDGVTKHRHKGGVASSHGSSGSGQQQQQQQQQQLGQATYDVAADIRQIKESIKEILEVVRTVRQALKQNEELADAELVYDRDKEDGLV